MINSAMGRVSFLAAAVLVGQQASLASAAPTCKRVAGQWAVVFSAECAQWFRQRGPRKGRVPESCTKGLTNAVLVEDFPWNEDVVIADNETPGDDISLQPEQNVVKYGAGIVIMQTTWDINRERLWNPRMSSSAGRVYSEVEYNLTDNNKYLYFDLSVRYEPTDSLFDEITSTTDGSDVKGVRDLKISDLAHDDNDVGMHHPPHDFSYSFEVQEFESYSFEFIDSFFEGEWPPYWESYSFSFHHNSYSFKFGDEEGIPPSPPLAVHSVTSMDIYVCTDEQNTLAELRFSCDPDKDGDAQCFAEAGPVNTLALEIHGMDMMCDKTCLAGQPGGTWCDIFGLDGCRMCTDDCTSLCDGKAWCSSCVMCRSPTAPPILSPTDDSDGFDNIATMSSTSSPTSAPTMTPTSSPSTSTMAPSATHSVSPSLTPWSILPLEPSYTAAPSTSASPTSMPTFVDFGSQSPTGAWQGIPLLSASPISGLAFTECTPGDSETCYNQLVPAMRGRLEAQSRGLTCEESCLVDGGLWCNALGLTGCRFCVTSCGDFCMGQSLPYDCDCIEC